MDEFDYFDRGNFLQRLGMHISRIRKSKGYSQDKACLEAGLSRGALSKIEQGKVEPKITTLATLALVLDVPLRKLIDIEVNEIGKK